MTKTAHGPRRSWARVCRFTAHDSSTRTDRRRLGKQIQECFSKLPKDAADRSQKCLACSNSSLPRVRAAADEITAKNLRYEADREAIA